VGTEAKINNSRGRPQVYWMPWRQGCVWRNKVADRISEEFYEALPGGRRASARSAQEKNSAMSSD
jgi:hypothetical protein